METVMASVGQALHDIGNQTFEKHKAFAASNTVLRGKKWQKNFESEEKYNTDVNATFFYYMFSPEE